MLIPNKKEFLWVEKYRPTKVKDCILPTNIKDIFQGFVTNKNIPNLLLNGPAGTGKTTIARALCEELECDYMFINSSRERGIGTLRTEIGVYASSMSLYGGRKVIIMDEADGITPDAQDALRGAIEEFSSNCSFILTCNFKAKLIAAINSRMATVEFKFPKEERPKIAQDFLVRLEEILKLEQIPYDVKVLPEFILKYFPDFRKILNECQKYSTSSGAINIGILSTLREESFKELMKFLKEKKFTEMRKWVGSNSDIDSSTLFRMIYDNLTTQLEPTSIPQAILTLADYQYKSAFVADPEINIVACLTEVMVNCTFK